MTAQANSTPHVSRSRLDSLVNDLKSRVEHTLHAALPKHKEALTPAISAERKTMKLRRGQVLSYYEDKHTHGRPLVLIHSINACASAFEVKPLFERFRGTRPVFAVDLPGFGFSERDARDYTPELYADELVDFLTRVKDKGDAPDVVALSLSSELVARAALARKDLVHTLTFISPTGLDEAGPSHDRSRLQKLGAHIQGAATRKWLAPLAFGAIASRPSIRYFLGKSFVGPVDEQLQSYAYATAHQPGAEHAPFAFLTGNLFTPDIRDTYAKLERPVMVLYDRDAYTHFGGLDELLERAPLWKAQRITPSMGMPQFERLNETASALEDFWSVNSHHAHGHHA